jgi:membrane protein YdbS with pleckstrin-like domain
VSSSDAVSPAPLQPENDPLDVDDLPRLRSDDFEPLDAAYVRMRTFGALLAGALAVAVTAVVTFATASWIALLIGAGVVLLIAVIGVVQRLEVAQMGYLVRTHDLSFRSGLLTRSVATVPFARLQHVAIGRGPLDRRFGLASLQLRTAGGHLAIAGLHHDVAERLKQLVTDRAAELAALEIDGDDA